MLGGHNNPCPLLLASPTFMHLVHFGHWPAASSSVEMKGTAWLCGQAQLLCTLDLGSRPGKGICSICDLGQTPSPFRASVSSPVKREC